MGNTIETMCKCENRNICGVLDSEIQSQNPKEIIQNNNIRIPKKNKEFKNSFQISGKITHFLCQNKIDVIEEENNFLNTAKNTMPSNILSNRSNAQNISDFNEEPLSIQIEKNKGNNIDIININEDKVFEQLSKIEDIEKDKNNLYNQKSKKTLENLLTVFSKELKLDNNKNINIYNNLEIKSNDEKKLYNEEIIEEQKEINSQNTLNLPEGKNLKANLFKGKLDGYMKYIDENGTLYEGMFNQGELNGIGKIIKIQENKNKSKKLINKISYNGNIKNFKKEGYGIEICAEYKYEGNFCNNLKNGKGKIEFLKTGDIYEGEFNNNKITGYGHYIWSNKHEYIGNFIEGEMNGKGRYIWPDGSEYEGEYINNIKEGVGKFKWTNGVEFKGNFHDGKPNGKGKIYYKGYIFDSEFKDGHFDSDLKAILEQIKNNKIPFSNK